MKVSARPKVTERALTIFRTRRSISDGPPRGMAARSLMHPKFNGHGYYPRRDGSFDRRD